MHLDNSTYPPRKVLRKMGYLSDQKGIINRYIAEGNAWHSHIEHTKNFIIKAAKNKSKAKVIVLGSGWLLDVPMDFLLNEFARVQLVDIIHPSQILHKYKTHTKVKFIEMDVTGGAINQIYNWVKDYNRHGENTQIEDVTGKPVNWNNKADFVISLNILNQLDILLLDYVKKYKILTIGEENTLRQIIQTNHLRSLPENKSCLITDYKENGYDASEALSHEKELIYTEFPKANYEEEWTWDFDLRKKYNAGKKTLFKVKAIDF